MNKFESWLYNIDLNELDNALHKNLGYKTLGGEKLFISDPRALSMDGKKMIIFITARGVLSAEKNYTLYVLGEHTISKETDLKGLPELYRLLNHSISLDEIGEQKKVKEIEEKFGELLLDELKYPHSPCNEDFFSYKKDSSRLDPWLDYIAKANQGNVNAEGQTFVEEHHKFLLDKIQKRYVIDEDRLYRRSFGSEKSMNEFAKFLSNKADKWKEQHTAEPQIEK